MIKLKNCKLVGASKVVSIERNILKSVLHHSSIYFSTVAFCLNYIAIRGCLADKIGDNK